MGTERFYIPGSFYRISDRSGFATRADRTRKEWTGRIVRDQEWEPRHPQDFVTGVRDDQTVPDPRPRPTDTYIGVLTTTLTAKAAAGATILSVASSVRMQAGDKATVMLDTGVPYATTILGLPNTTSITIASPGLPYSASVGNIVTDTSAVAAANIG